MSGDISDLSAHSDFDRAFAHITDSRVLHLAERERDLWSLCDWDIFFSITTTLAHEVFDSPTLEDFFLTSRYLQQEVDRTRATLNFNRVWAELRETCSDIIHTLELNYQQTIDLAAAISTLSPAQRDVPLRTLIFRFASPTDGQ